MIQKCLPQPEQIAHVVPASAARQRLPPNRYEIDLSIEVLNIDFCQGAAKIPKVKVGVQKKYLPTRLTPETVGSNLADRQIFFPNSNFDF